jgi:hypothetical protein
MTPNWRVTWQATSDDENSYSVEVAGDAVKMDKDYLVLKRASASRLSGEWNDDDCDVLCDSVVVGRT